MRALANPVLKTLLMAWCLAASAPVTLAYASDPERLAPIQEARAAVNHAWEVYHRAALSGTLESPALQVSIEKDLRAARALLAEVERSDDPGAMAVSNGRIDRIRELTDRIITQSHRRKQ
jgi:hypothetical protein